MGQKRDKAAAAQAAAKRAASKPQPVNYVAWVGAVVIGVLAFELAGLRPWLLGGDAGASTTPARTPSERGQRLASEDLSEDDVAAHVERVRKAESAALPCENESPDCVNWAQSGECEKNSGYMHKACRPACGLCTAPPGSPSAAPACADTHRMCATWASIGECGTNPSFMNSSCRVACRLCQSEACSDKRDDCEELSRGGGCYTRPRMREECAWSCVSCDVSNETQCTRDRSRPAAAVKGSVERMFELIRAAGGAAGAEAGGEGAAAEDAEAVARVRAALAGGKVHVHSTDPWVLTIDDFLSSKDADAVLAAGSDNWSRSLAGDGEQAVRTSSTSWCRRRCLRDATVIDVQNRVERLTGVPTENAEFMQALRYEPGQFYKTHHDQNSPRASAWGPRLYTFFMYLSDVEAGGGTRFPRLNITVEPKKGRALLWTSVLDADPFERDDRTDHEALEVERGIKYAANYWLHMFPFRELSEKGCDNAPYAVNWY